MNSRIMLLILAIGLFTNSYAQTKSTSLPSMSSQWEKFNNAVNKHDLKALASVLANDAKIIQTPDAFMEYRGKDTIRMMYAGYFQFIPDFRIISGKIVTQGKTMVVQHTITGVFQSPPPGYAPEITTNRFTNEAVAWVEFDSSNRIKKIIFYWDMLSQLNQAGWRNIIPGR
jgi:SnoaL-like domain